MEHNRAILHVDMDAFYASVEQHDQPELKGKPVIVGGTGARGVVAAASYEVRRFGVHSAMPMGEALRRCPHAICIPPRMRRYKEVSKQVFAVFHQFTPQVEGLSLDEAFLDLSASVKLFGPAEEIAREIKRRIRDATGLTASVGLASNKLLAKIASELGKPDGCVWIRPEEVTTVLDPLPIRRLNGVGKKTAAKLEEHGIHTLGQLRLAPDSVLWPLFGRFTQRMRERAAGIDDRPVVSDWEEKSISAEETFEHDIRQHEQLYAELASLADRTCERMRAKQLMAGQVYVKIRRRDFTTYTRQQTFSPPTQDSKLILWIAKRLLGNWLKTQPRAAIRLLGVGVAALIPAQQLDLFASGRSNGTGTDTLGAAIDRIHEQFGEQSLTRASSLRN
ncbi:MAG TPA: DNA polymerase IV [Steroidobacteraceae bacterium]|nr:DNA polymerase IV [Steroidobacteraceae bacterium]